MPLTRPQVHPRPQASVLSTKAPVQGAFATKRMADVLAGSEILLLHDDFYDSNGTPLTSHAPVPVNVVGAGWVSINYNATITSNRLYPQNVTGGAVVAIDTLYPDGHFFVTLYKVAALNTFPHGFAFRSDSTIRWSAGLIPGLTPSVLQIFEHPSTVRAQADCPTTIGQAYTLELILKDEFVQLSCNGVTISYDFAAAYNTNSLHGLRGRQDAAWFDDYKVYR